MRPAIAWYSSVRKIDSRPQTNGLCSRKAGYKHGPPPNGPHRNQIDYILRSHHWRNSVSAVKTFSGDDYDFDHKLLAAEIRIKSCNTKKCTPSKNSIPPKSICHLLDCSSYWTIPRIPHASKVLLKVIQERLRPIIKRSSRRASRLPVAPATTSRTCDGTWRKPGTGRRIPICASLIITAKLRQPRCHSENSIWRHGLVSNQQRCTTGLHPFAFFVRKRKNGPLPQCEKDKSWRQPIAVISK